MNETLSERRPGSESVTCCGESGGELEGSGKDLDGTDVERELSSDRLWIAKNRSVLERLCGGRNVNHGWGVLSRRLRS